MSNYEATRLAQPVKPTTKPEGRGKRFAKWVAKIAGATIIVIITATLFSLLVFGGAIAGILNSMKAEGSTPEVTSPEDVFESVEDEDGGVGIGGITETPSGDTTIELEATSSGPATVTWSGPGSFGNTVPIEANEQWSMEIPDGEADGFYNVSVASDDYDNTSDVSCKITVDGEVPPEGAAEASGIAAIADCNKAMME